MADSTHLHSDDLQLVLTPQSTQLLFLHSLQACYVLIELRSQSLNSSIALGIDLLDLIL